MGETSLSDISKGSPQILVFYTIGIRLKRRRGDHN